MAGADVESRSDAWRGRELRRAYRREQGVREKREAEDESLPEKVLGVLVTFAFEAVAFFLRTIPLEVALDLGATLASLFGLVGRRWVKVGLANLAIAFPEKDLAWRRRVLARAFANMGRTIVEVIRLPTLSRRELARLVTLEGHEHIPPIIAAKQGFLVLSGHLGNFELLAPTGNWLFGVKSCLVGRRVKLAAADRILRGLRSSQGVDTVVNKEAVGEVLARVRQGEAIGIVLDQNMKTGLGVFVPFFGKLASTTPGLALIARRTKAPVIPFFMERRGHCGRHACVAQPPVPWEVGEGDKRDATVTMTARYTRVIEDAVRRRPEEWFWFHQRWRSRPPGEV